MYSANVHSWTLICCVGTPRPPWPFLPDAMAESATPALTLSASAAATTPRMNDCFMESWVPRALTRKTLCVSSPRRRCGQQRGHQRLGQPALTGVGWPAAGADERQVGALAGKGPQAVG